MPSMSARKLNGEISKFVALKPEIGEITLPVPVMVIGVISGSQTA